MPATSQTRKLLSRLPLGIAAAGALLSLSLWIAPVRAAEDAFIIPPPTQDLPATSATQTAVFAGGCFWGVQGVFQHTVGVLNAVSGYAGGAATTAQYDTVSRGDTGHAEAVQIKYDPNKVSYGKLLQIYFSVVHDPTQLNRQGPDSGTQYRSTIFAGNEAQKTVAVAYIAQLNATKIYKKPIATTIEMNKPFYVAEDYHQDYLTLHPNQPYIAYNDIPKVHNLKKVFSEDYRDTPALVRDVKATN
jgi:peptide-methionine (S)-S-oxide reductase